MLYIRRKIINDIAGSQQKQKAVAFALMLKEKTSNSSVIRKFTIYKIHKLTCDKDGKCGMAYKTIRKYLDVLLKMELAVIRDGDLYIKKMSSSSKHRNINISKLKINKTRNVFNQIRDLLFLLIQSHKDYIKSILQLRKDPPKGTDFKKVRRLCKKCCKNPDAEFADYGISYRKVAKQVGCCVKTAIKVVSDAVKRKWCFKTNNCEVHELFGVNYRKVPGYTFTSRNYGYILRSNTYTLSKSWSKSLNCVACVPMQNRYGISDKW